MPQMTEENYRELREYQLANPPRKRIGTASKLSREQFAENVRTAMSLQKDQDYRIKEHQQPHWKQD